MLIGLLLLAALLYFHGLAQTLPYNFNDDELLIWQRVEHLLRTGQLNSSYPPLRLISLMLETRVMEWVSPNGASLSVVQLTARVTTALYTMLMFAATYQAGRQIHSPAAGIAAVIYLIVHTTVLNFGRVFKTDSFAWLWAMLTIVLVFRALHTHNRKLVLLAFVCALAAFFSKYTMLPLLSLPGVAAIVILPRSRSQRNTILVALALLLLIGLVLLLHPSRILLRLSPDHAYILQSLYERENVLSFVSLFSLWPAIRDSLGQFYFGVAVGLALVLVLWKRDFLSRGHIHRLLLLSLPLVLTYLMLSLLTLHRGQDWMLIVLTGALIWGVLLAVAVHQNAYLAAALGLLLVLGDIFAAWQLGQQWLAPDSRIATAEWAATLPSGTHIGIERQYGEFDTLAGLQPTKRFFLHDLNSVHEQPLESYAQQGIEYLIADGWRWDQNTAFFFRSPAANQAFVDQTETIVNWSQPEQQGWQGPPRRIFKVPALQQQPMHVFFGNEIIFKGFDIASLEIKAGDVINLVLYWSMLAETSHDYMMYMHVFSPDGELAAQQDGAPLGLGNPTYYWPAGSFQWGDWSIQLPADLPAGEYTIRLGLYDRDTQVRLPATDADGTPIGDGIILTEIEVLSK